MKFLKIIFYLLIGIILLLLVIAALVPDNITITTGTTIDAPSEKVYNNVVSLKNWKNWSPFEHDSTMTDTFSGPDSGVGATRIWKGKTIGEGKMTIVKAIPFTLIKNQLDFGPKGNATGTWTFSAVDSTHTKVTWSTHISGFSYPFERLLGTVLSPIMKPMFENGLADLKEYTETGKVTVKQPDSLNQTTSKHE